MPLGAGAHILFEGRPRNKTANPISLYRQGVRKFRPFQISCLVSGFLLVCFLPIQCMTPLLVVPVAHIRPESRSKA